MQKIEHPASHALGAVDAQGDVAGLQIGIDARAGIVGETLQLCRSMYSTKIRAAAILATLRETAAVRLFRTLVRVGAGATPTWRQALAGYSLHAKCCAVPLSKIPHDPQMKGGEMQMSMPADHMFRLLQTCDVDELDFGVIGFDSGGLVRVYNRTESVAAGLAPERVLGLHVFETVAPCMNNFLVAQRFEDAEARQDGLDVEIDYVLTLRMKPTPVRLRLLSEPEAKYRYILVTR